MTTALYTWDIGSKLGEEYVRMVNDMLRTAVIQVSVQLLLSLVDGDNNTFFSGVFWLVLLYLQLGVVAYHLAFSKLMCVR
jgi:hypothetical protein